MVWSDANQLNGVCQVGRSSGYELFSNPVSTYLTPDSTVKKFDEVNGSVLKTTTASMQPSPPIFHVVMQDSSTQTNEAEITEALQQEGDKKCNKQALLKVITVKRSASFGDHRKENTLKNDETMLSRSSSSLRREYFTEDHPTQKPKRSKSLKTTRDTFKV